jgi:predicted DNA-binding transcriptional regulator AlpA
VIDNIVLGNLMIKIGNKLVAGEYALDKDELDSVFKLFTQKKLTVEQVCCKCNISRATLYRRIKSGKFPQPHKDHGGRKYFWLRELETILNSSGL